MLTLRLSIEVKQTKMISVLIRMNNKIVKNKEINDAAAASCSYTRHGLPNI